MKKEEVRSILLKEADKCQRFADECHRKRNGCDDYDDLSHYWIGKRRGFLDAVKYLDRIGDDDE